MSVTGSEVHVQRPLCGKDDEVFEDWGVTSGTGVQMVSALRWA